jgi:hypothetical protein
MNKFSKYTFILFTQLVLAVSLLAQDAMRISGTQIVRKGETMTIDAGKVLQFEPGATLQIEGSLVVRGTTDKPVVMQSLDASNPGNGLMIRGIDEAGSIVLENVKAEGLVQPLRFDPFWYRKRVDLSGVTVSGSNSGEPVVYVAGPLLDLRDGMDIQFSMKSMKFFNNTGAVLLEKVGSDGIVYELDNLLFSENRLPGSDATMGILHLDVSRTSNSSQVKIGSLAFNRNTSGDKLVGLSVSGGNGTGTEKFGVDAVYAASNGTVVYDNRVNSRVPTLEIGKVGGLAGYSEEKDFVVSAKHTFGKVKMNVVGNPRVVKMEDSLGRPVFNNANRLGDTLELSYLEGNPTVITLANGQKFMVPKLTAAELPPPIYRKVDTTLISPMWPDTTKTGSGIGGSLSLRVSIPTGGSLNPLDSMKNWEVGQWFGGAIYGGGDIRHKFFPLPSTMEYSYAIYLQRNYRKLSWSADYNYCKISMHNLWSPSLFSGGKLNDVLSVSGEKIKPFPNSFSLMFVTPMHVLGINGIWHIGKNELINRDKGKWVNSVGVGLGILYFNPYRLPWLSPNGYNKKTGKYERGLLDSGIRTETYEEWNERILSNRIYLREVGTEGQNFILGMKKYSPVAAFGSFEYRLSYLRKKWNFKMSMKATISTTDYLDDMGSGTFYGGDREKMLEYAVSNLQYTRGVLETAFPKLPDDAFVGSTKSINGLPDGFFQMHMGVSYYIGYNLKKRK